MHADGCVDKRMLFGLANGHREIGRAVARADGQNIFQSASRARWMTAADRRRTAHRQDGSGNRRVPPISTERRRARFPGRIRARANRLRELAATIMPCEVSAAEFARFEIGDDGDFAADEFFGLIGEGDAGDDGARLGFADVDGEVQEFVGALYVSAVLISPTRRSTLMKSSMVMVGARAVVGGGLGGFGVVPEQGGLTGFFDFFEISASFRWRLGFDAREDGGDFTKFLTGGRWPQWRSLVGTESRGRVKPSCCQIFAPMSGRTGRARPQMMRRLRRRCKECGRDLLGLRPFIFGELPGSTFDDEFVDHGDQGPDGFESLREFEFVVMRRAQFDSWRRLGDVAVVHPDSGIDAVAVLMNHAEGAAGEVAEAVGEIGIIAADEGVVS